MRYFKSSKKVFIFFIGLGVGFCFLMAAEYAVSYFSKTIDFSLKRAPDLLYTPFVEWTYNPDHYVLNSAGLRDIEFSEKKPKNTFRVLCIGDSCVMGYGSSLSAAAPSNINGIITGSFPSRLRRKLHKINNSNIEVINAGVPGYVITQSFLFLQMTAYSWEPDAIVYFSQHDDPRWRYKISSKYKFITSPVLRPLSRLAFKSSTFRVITFMLNNSRTNSAESEKEYNSTKDTHAKTDFELLAEYCKKRSIHLIFVSQARRSYDSIHDRNGLLWANMTMRDLASDNEKISYVNINKQIGEKKEFFSDRFHFNDDGYEIIARELYNTILKEDNAINEYQL